jgi:hypothetical protein
MADFATLNDVIAISGATYTTAEQERITVLLPLVSDALRFEADKVGKDLDAMAEDTVYANTLKLVTCDIVIRAMRQSSTGEPMSQESQAALGYSWSGTYAIPGGGIAQAIMKNDLKRLGLRRQRMGVIDLCPESTE